VTRRHPHDRDDLRDGGFTLLEVLVTLMILAVSVPLLWVTVGNSVDRALVTKVNRQMRALAQFQIGQITVGKLHPDEEDPFPDGQSGTFDDVGGYPEEYAAFTWKLQREEIGICGTTEDDLQKAGFVKPATGGPMVRPQTDDILAGTNEHLEKPAGQFKSRVTLTVYWHGESADEDLELTVVTYLPVNGEEDGGGAGAGGKGEPGPAGAGAGAGSGAAGAGTGATGDQTGTAVRKG
jgi:prepilin-type N-terminal cleavage/methylation domain-containing protein